MFACMWRPEIEIKYLSLLITTLFFETGLSVNVELTNSSKLTGR